MLVGEAIGDSDNRYGIQAGGIGDELPQVRVVGPLQLVFNQNPMIGRRVLTQNIGSEWLDVFSCASTLRSMPMVSPSSAMLSSRASHGVKLSASFSHTLRSSTFSSRPKFFVFVVIV